MSVLRLQPRAMRGSQPRSLDDPAVQHEVELMELHTNLLLDLCANRCWSQTFYGLCFPFALAQVFCESEADRNRASATMSRMCAGILALEDYTLQNPTNAAALRLLESVGTHKWQLVREMLVMGFQANWDWQDSELRTLAWALFSSPMCTKSTLESAFNHIRDSGKRHNKNDSMASMTRYSYLALQPYARSETGGVCQVELAEQDFSAVGTNATARNAISKLKPFKPSATPMPKVYPHPKDIREKWRPAGFAANRKAAAAMALVMWDQPNWNRIGGAWTGGGFLDSGYTSGI